MAMSKPSFEAVDLVRLKQAVGEAAVNRALRKDQITPKRLGFFGPSRNVPGKQRVLACAAKRTLVCR